MAREYSCPKCGRPAAIVDEDHYRCEDCGMEFMVARGSEDDDAADMIDSLELDEAVARLAAEFENRLAL
jgi:DNA-directed RNA polymerase subunit RPC12/RpoP